MDPNAGALVAAAVGVPNIPPPPNEVEGFTEEPNVETEDDAIPDVDPKDEEPKAADEVEGGVAAADSNEVAPKADVVAVGGLAAADPNEEAPNAGAGAEEPKTEEEDEILAPPKAEGTDAPLPPPNAEGIDVDPKELPPPLPNADFMADCWLTTALPPLLKTDCDDGELVVVPNEPNTEGLLLVVLIEEVPNGIK